MALPNLHGYWKYADAVVPFRIEPIDRPQIAPSFIQRPPKPVVQRKLKDQALKELSGSSNGNGHQGKRSLEITSETIDQIDWDF